LALVLALGALGSASVLRDAVLMVLPSAVSPKIKPLIIAITLHISM
jgi:hypothetical protein